MLTLLTRLLTVPAAAVVLLTASACTTSSGQPNRPTAVPPTPMAQLNTAAMSLVRGQFCSLLSPTSVRAALAVPAPSSSSSSGSSSGASGPAPVRRTTWSNGQVAALGGAKDVSHEYGCRWTSGSSSAAAWVFATPVDVRLAHRVIADSRTTDCVVKAATFGSPSAVQTCAEPDRTQRVRYVGLFGDTWLTCETSAYGEPLSALVRGTQAWCVQVATATNTQR